MEINDVHEIVLIYQPPLTLFYHGCRKEMTSQVERRGISRWTGRIVDLIRVGGILEKKSIKKVIFKVELNEIFLKKYSSFLFYTINKI